jgi:hypothetical protein
MQLLQFAQGIWTKKNIGLTNQQDWLAALLIGLSRQMNAAIVHPP